MRAGGRRIQRGICVCGVLVRVHFVLGRDPLTGRSRAVNFFPKKVCLKVVIRQYLEEPVHLERTDALLKRRRIADLPLARIQTELWQTADVLD